jgi:hypothetical protein
MRSAASALLAGSWNRVMPASLQAIAQKPLAVSKTKWQCRVLMAWLVRLQCRMT